MSIHRQGYGEQRVITAIAPTTRTNGEAFDAATELNHYNFYIAYNGAPANLVGAVQLVGGAFTDTIDVDNVAIGVYDVQYSSVDLGGREGPLSAPATIEVLGPLAPPNPPTGVV